MRLTPSLLLVALTAVLLSACGEPGTDDTARSATGEVLEGTISDAMLPLATVRSQPPLLPPEEQEERNSRPSMSRAAPGAESGATPPTPDPVPPGAIDAPAQTPQAATPPAE